MSQRVHNFGAGPATLPLDVLQRVQADLLDFESTGMSILEMSHRSKVYDRVHQEAMSGIKALLGAGDDYEVLFMGGGARTQFALVPMNLRPSGTSADYWTTGNWSRLAIAEARKVGEAREPWSSEETGHDRVPQAGEVEVDPAAAYLHYTSNNTVAGTQYHYVPDAGDVPLVCDMSSDIFSRPVDLKPFGLIYAGAQKNLGPAGVTVVIVRRDLWERSPASLPDTMSYAKMAAKASLLNTPPVFAIYVAGLVVKKLLAGGGLGAVEAHNQSKAATLYGAIDASEGFYRGHAQAASRSLMNVTFRLNQQDLEPGFIAEAAEAGLVGLKGHRSVGGIRASIYNAMSSESVSALVDFMSDFQSRHG